MKDVCSESKFSFIVLQIQQKSRFPKKQIYIIQKENKISQIGHSEIVRQNVPMNGIFPFQTGCFGNIRLNIDVCVVGEISFSVAIFHF